jgi:acetyltransferase EpsM
MTVARRGVVVVGAGGHAKVVISALRASGHDVIAVVDDDPLKWGTRVLGVEVSGPTDSGLGGTGVIAVGDNRARAALAERLTLDWLTVVHPRAFVDGTAALAPGAVVLAGAVVQAEARVGRHAIVNSGAVVEHDAVVGVFAHAGPNATLAGNVRVGEGALVGAGASVAPGACVGAWATVGAGAVVVRVVPDATVAYGVPARPRR